MRWSRASTSTSRFSSFADVGYKALAVNVSDIAAMGGTPRLALLSLILPERLTVAEIDALLDGFARNGRGGGGDPRRRQHHPFARPADRRRHGRRRRPAAAGPDPRAAGRATCLYVTGAIGAAAAGLGWLRRHRGAGQPEPEDIAALIARHRRPAPRTPARRDARPDPRRHGVHGPERRPGRRGHRRLRRPAEPARSSTPRPCPSRTPPGAGSTAAGRRPGRAPPWPAATTTSCCSRSRHGAADGCGPSSSRPAASPSRASASSPRPLLSC